MVQPGIVLNLEAIRDHPDAAKVTIEGSIDPKSMNQYKAVMDKVLASSTKRLLIDCQKLTYINSSGLAYLLNVVGTLKPKGGSVALSGVDSKIQVIFKMMEISALFEWYPSYRDALRVLDEKLARELSDVGPALKLEEPAKPVKPPAPTPKPAPKTGRLTDRIPRTSRIIPVPPPPPSNPFVQFFRWLFGGDSGSGTTRIRRNRR